MTLATIGTPTTSSRTAPQAPRTTHALGRQCQPSRPQDQPAARPGGQQSPPCPGAGSESPPRRTRPAARRPRRPGLPPPALARAPRPRTTPHCARQAQSVGQQIRGVLAGGPVNAPFEVADRPRGPPPPPAPPASAVPRRATAAAAQRNSAQAAPAPGAGTRAGRPGVRRERF